MNAHSDSINRTPLARYNSQEDNENLRSPFNMLEEEVTNENRVPKTNEIKHYPNK